MRGILNGVPACPVSAKYPEAVFFGPHLKPLVAFDEGFRQAVARAGIEHLTIHDLRAFFITQSLMAGVVPSTVARIAGIKTVSMMMKRYRRFLPSHWEGAIKRFDKFVTHDYPKNTRKKLARKMIDPKVLRKMEVPGGFEPPI